MALGIDINKPRRVFIASIDELENLKDSQQGQSQIAKFENDVDVFLKRNNYKMHFRNASRQIIIIDNMIRKMWLNLLKSWQDMCGKKISLN